MVAKNKRLLNSINYRNADGSFNFQPVDTATLASDPVTGQITAVLPAGVNVYATPGNLPLTNVNTGQIAFAESNNKMYIWTGTGWISITTVNRAPQITVGPNATYSFALDGTPIILSLDAIDSDQTPITWSYTTTSLGNIATISQDSSQFTITPSTNDSDAGSFTMTFIASDGINTDTAQAIFSLVFVSEYWKDVVLNIGTSSTPGRRNSTYIDRSIYAATLAANTATTPTQTAFHPYLENWSVYLDGNDSISFPSSAEFNVSNGDFTFETWVNTTRAGGTIFDFGGNVNVTYNGWRVGFTSGGAVQLVINQQSNSASGEFTLTGVGTTPINNGVWHHIRITRTGTAFRIFIDGVLDQSGTSSVTGYQAATAFYVGATLLSNAPSPSFTGYFSNFRLIKGTSLNTTDDSFTPPTENLTNVSGTSLLLFNSNRFIDQSTTSHVFTFISDPEISAFNPFGQPEAYTIANNLGSAYFKPSIDSHITSTYTTNYYDWWTEDYTIEAWVYPLSLTGWYYSDEYPSMIGNAQVGSATNYWSFGLINTGAVRLYYYNGSPQTNLTSTETVKINQWNHIAMVKNSSGVKIFVNGVGTSYLTINGTPQSNTGTPLTIGRINSTNIQGYVSDLKISKGTAAYMADFTPPTSALTNTNATFYLPMDDAGIFDTTSNNTLLIVGDTSTSATQTKFASTSVYFDGNGDYINLAFLGGFGASNFTLEFWFYRNTGTSPIFNSRTSGSGGDGFDIFSTGKVTTASLVMFNDMTLNDNQWYHFVLVRNNGTITRYLDGVANGSISNTTNFNGSDFYIGGSPHGNTGSLNGYIENLQIIKGVAKYTTNFTPPTVPQNIQNQLTS